MPAKIGINVLIRLRNVPTKEESVAVLVVCVGGILLARGRDAARRDAVYRVGNHLPQKPRAKVDCDAEDNIAKVLFCILQFGGVAACGNKQKARVDKKQHGNRHPKLQKCLEECLHQAAKTFYTKRVLEDKTAGIVAGW